MAQDINVVVLTGRLADAPELKKTSAGTSIMSFTLVNSKPQRKEKEQWVKQHPNYFNIIVWGRQAEVLQPYMSKGKQIAVTGRLQQRSYQLTDESRKRSVVEIVADNIQLLGSKEITTQNLNDNDIEIEAKSVNTNVDTSSAVIDEESFPEDDLEPVPDDDIPF